MNRVKKVVVTVNEVNDFVDKIAKKKKRMTSRKRRKLADRLREQKVAA